ncbi:MAG: hypothetical protein U1C97_00265 [Candidatus Gracilibacteria bacterium]|nr:hypothetical protein [Candidatus Gracilibacteria bacterium]
MESKAEYKDLASLREIYFLTGTEAAIGISGDDLSYFGQANIFGKPFAFGDITEQVRGSFRTGIDIFVFGHRFDEDFCKLSSIDRFIGLKRAVRVPTDIIIRLNVADTVRVRMGGRDVRESGVSGWKDDKVDKEYKDDQGEAFSHGKKKRIVRACRC